MAYQLLEAPLDLNPQQPFDHTYVHTSELIRLNVVAAGVHLLNGILGSFIIRSYDPALPIIAPLFKYLSGEEGRARFLESTPKTWGNVHILEPLVVVEWITFAFHVVYWAALIWPQRVDQRIVRRLVNNPSANPLRWVEYAITATTMSAFGAVAIGITDAYYLLKMVSAGVALQACGYLIECLDCKEPRDVRIFKTLWWVIGNVLNLTSIVVLLYQIFASNTGAVRGVFIENSLPFAFWFNSFGVVCRWDFYKKGRFVDRYYTERWYIVLSLSTKFAVFWLGLGSFRRIIEINGAAPPLGVNWDVIRYCAMTLPVVWILGYLWWDAIYVPHKAAPFGRPRGAPWAPSRAVRL